LVLSPIGLINLGFTTEGRLDVLLIITFSWGFQLGGYIYKTPTSTPHHQWGKHLGSRTVLMLVQIVNKETGGEIVINDFTSAQTTQAYNSYWFSIMKTPTSRDTYRWGQGMI
jgi:hypothetical protein